MLDKTDSTILYKRLTGFAVVKTESTDLYKWRTSFTEIKTDSPNLYKHPTHIADHEYKRTPGTSTKCQQAFAVSVNGLHEILQASHPHCHSKNGLKEPLDTTNDLLLQ